VEGLAKFEARLVPGDGAPVVVVSGEVDAASAGRLRAVIIEAIDLGAAQVAFDLGGVDFIDAAGIGVLMSAVNRAKEQGSRLVLRSASSRVRRVLELVDLEGTFPEES
jgi:anti-anti-sigma factor